MMYRDRNRDYLNNMSLSDLLVKIMKEEDVCIVRVFDKDRECEKDMSCEECLYKWLNEKRN